MAEHPNATLVRGVYDQWARGDATALPNACSEDVVFHVSGNHQLSGDHVGPEGVLALLRQLQAAEGEFCMTYDGAFANDGYVLVLTGCTARRDGRPLSWRVFDILRVENGKISEFWTFAHPQARSDEFWS